MLHGLKTRIDGHLIIKDDLGNLLLDKKNAIHPENMSITIAKALQGDAEGHIQEMHFGFGGSNVTGIGTISYLPPKTTEIDQDLYLPSYFKVVNQNSSLNTDPSKNNITTSHTVGTLFTDILVKCTLEFNEPAGQQAFDTAINAEGEFVFDEIGLKSFDSIPGNGLLLTHVIFNPIQKSLNRQIEIEYTLRIQPC